MGREFVAQAATLLAASVNNRSSVQGSVARPAATAGVVLMVMEGRKGTQLKLPIELRPCGCRPRTIPAAPSLRFAQPGTTTFSASLKLPIGSSPLRYCA